MNLGKKVGLAFLVLQRQEWNLLTLFHPTPIELESVANPIMMKAYGAAGGAPGGMPGAGGAPGGFPGGAGGPAGASDDGPSIEG